MARCDRHGTIYKRHKFNKGVCRCGAKQLDHLRAVANRRAQRKVAKAVMQEIKRKLKRGN